MRCLSVDGGGDGGDAAMGSAVGLKTRRTWVDVCVERGEEVKRLPLIGSAVNAGRVLVRPDRTAVDSRYNASEYLKSLPRCIVFALSFEFRQTNDEANRT